MADLEVEIDTLRELDALRIESGRLRDEGVKVLTALVEQDKIQDRDLLEFTQVSMALWELSSDPPKKLKEQMKELEDLKLEAMLESPVPILLSTGVLQALTAVPGFAFTKSFPFCYYLIIRELYTVDAPDWAVGGARADPKGGVVSASVTRECVRALLSLTRVLENTSDFIEKIGAIQKRADQLKRMQDSFPELEEFIFMEGKRLKFALHTTIRKFSRRLVIQPPEPLDLPGKPPLIYVEKAIANIASQLGKTARNAEENFKNALSDTGEIKKSRDEEDFYSRRDEDRRLRFIRSEAGHFIATSAIEKGKKNAEELTKLFISPDWHKEFEKWKDLKKGVDKAAKQIRELLHPVENFLSSVLDRELAAASRGSFGGWDVVEMACSAAAYGEVTEKTEEWGDDKLHRAADCLKKVISDHGRSLCANIS